MAIISKGAVLRDIPSEFKLDKLELLALIPEGHYLKEIANWYKVLLNYQSSDLSQNIAVVIDMTSEDASGYFSASEKASESFQIKFITIWDFDGGKYTVNRLELNPVDFDINMDIILGTEDDFRLVQENESFIII